MGGAHLDTSRWLADDFAGVKIKNFDEMRENFIEDLTNQFSDLLVPQARDRHQSVKISSSSANNNMTLIDHDNETMAGEGNNMPGGE